MAYYGIPSAGQALTAGVGNDTVALANLGGTLVTAQSVYGADGNDYFLVLLVKPPQRRRPSLFRLTFIAGGTVAPFLVTTLFLIWSFWTFCAVHQIWFYDHLRQRYRRNIQRSNLRCHHIG